MATYREENRDKIREKLNTPENKFNIYRRSAGRRGFDFELTFEEFIEFWQYPCEYCGSEIGTIRVDNSQGYSPENIVPCCTTCNKMKMAINFRRIFGTYS